MTATQNEIYDFLLLDAIGTTSVTGYFSREGYVHWCATLQADIVEADGATVAFEDLFDAVLVDAPCTATGTLRRHPEAAWIKSPEDVAALQKTQTRLLRHAISLTKPGGTIVYCVCSLEPEEGPDVAAQILAGGGAERSPIEAGEAGPFAEGLLPDGDLRVFPFMLAEHGGCDGFYMTRLKRV